jgi:tRNA(fMet)-specific endonuclease VapC
MLIGAERRSIDFEALLDALGDEPVSMAAITAAELLHGCERADDTGTRARRAAFAEALLTVVPVRS